MSKLDNILDSLNNLNESISKEKVLDQKFKEEAIQYFHQTITLVQVVKNIESHNVDMKKTWRDHIANCHAQTTHFIQKMGDIQIQLADSIDKKVKPMEEKIEKNRKARITVYSLISGLSGLMVLMKFEYMKKVILKILF